MKKILEINKNLILSLFFYFILCGNIHSINLDDNRTDPFEGIDDFDGVVYLK